MLERVFNYFERWVDPIQIASDPAPPNGLKAFYLYFLRQIWPIITLACLLAALSAFTDAIIPVFIGWIVDLFNKSSPETVWQDGRWMFIGIFVLLLLRPILAFLQMLVSYHAQFPGFTNLIRWQSHYHVSKQSLHFFQSDFAGRIANKVIQTGMALRASVMSVQDSIWYVGAFILSALFFIGSASVYLTIPVILWLSAYIIVLVFFLPKIREQSSIMSDAHSTLTGRVVDSYTNIQTVKLFSGGLFEDNYIADAIRAHTRQMLGLFKHFTFMWLALHILNGSLMLSVGVLTIILWQNAMITIGEVAMVLPLTLQLRNMAAWVMEIANGVFENAGTVEEGMETIAKPLTVVDVPHAPTLTVSKGKIDFKNVDFDYATLSKTDDKPEVEDLPVITDFNLTIEPGQKVGLVGRSGAGKSTLVNLILRLYDINSGEIIIDGQNIAHVTQESLRRQIGMVTQDTSLLHRTIRENLMYGNDRATEETMIKAAKQAEADDYITTLFDGKGGMGYDTLVGDRGVKLSGGQRQRIAIARVILKNAPILILDEATSALDSEVEQMIQRQLHSMMQGKTVIAIAHRLSTIAEMDRLIVMEKGQIVEDGSHDELIKQDSIYANLWSRQSGGFLGAKV